MHDWTKTNPPRIKSIPEKFANLVRNMLDMKHLIKSWNWETSSKLSINYTFLPITQYIFFNEEFWSQCHEIL
jgi:hypothetical protein